jgi:hypothetical protein
MTGTTYQANTFHDNNTAAQIFTLALLDDGLDVADAVTGLGIDGHSAGKGLHKELHD